MVEKMLKNKRNRDISGTPFFLKLLIGIIFGYILLHVFMYQKSDKTAIYEVRYGYLSRNNVLRGLCLREEKIVKSKASGHINYFVSGSDRVGVNTIVYSLDSNGSIYEYIKETKEELSLVELREIRRLSRTFFATFHPSDFNRLLPYNSSLDVYLTNIKADKALNKLKKLDEKTSLSFRKYKALSAGNIAFYTDGFENKTQGSVSYSELYDDDYQRQDINNNDEIEEGSPVYKLLKNERWKLLCPLEPEVYKQLEEIVRNKGSLDGDIPIRVKFLADATYTNCNLELAKKEGKDLAVLTFTDSAVRFLNDRYLDIELQLKQNIGLQIPITSIVQKSFFKVPKEYADRGGGKMSSNSYGVIKKTAVSESNKSGREFIEISNIAAEEDFVYIPADKFEDSQILINPSDNKTEYVLTDKLSLNGVYNINKGYAVFNYIEIIDKNDQYYIVDDKKSMIGEFDHIVLDGKSASENMILNQKGVK